MKTLIKKRAVLIITLLLFVATSNAQWKKIKGNGNMTTETRTTSNYDGIKCSGSFDYKLVSGTEGKITIEAEENLLEYIIIEVKDNNLIVKTKKGTNLSSSNKKGIVITIPFEDISNVSLSGSGDLWNEDKINSSNFSVSLSGSGDMIIDLNSTSVNAAISGSGDLTVKGNTTNLEARVSGSGDFHGFDLQSNNTDVSVAGSGDARVTSNETLKARVAGSGDIVYKGNPKTDTKVAGSGSISK
ncbi:Putative auto-transporter adhesin, head GIN domain [Flaviramulus basaltis]|uniref:Putative auto-transporter adhesin, head GIN domain n=1 Tax=Flaviramulus basaltis TaxID=369401 RepID=A0A1K2IPH6_9FLAO|nr:head GIN domain-containing protein [Flaviramulus basaltis]SFZ94349.1 Putative auto-transporter adhesin, head GIN domain [Flaviramulus basaltis]